MADIVSAVHRSSPQQEPLPSGIRRLQGADCRLGGYDDAVTQPQVNLLADRGNNRQVCKENSDNSSEYSSNPAADLAEHAVQTTDFVGDLPGVTGDLTMRKLAAFSIDWAREEMWVDTGIRPTDETCADAEDLLVARGWTIIRTREEDAARRRGKYDFYGED